MLTDVFPIIGFFGSKGCVQASRGSMHIQGNSNLLEIATCWSYLQSL